MEREQERGREGRTYVRGRGLHKVTHGSVIERSKS